MHNLSFLLSNRPEIETIDHTMSVPQGGVMGMIGFFALLFLFKRIVSSHFISSWPQYGIKNGFCSIFVSVYVLGEQLIPGIYD